MSKTIEISEAQWRALQEGRSITIDPPNAKKWTPEGGPYLVGVDGEILRHQTAQHIGQNFGMRYKDQATAKRASVLMRPHHRLIAYALEFWPRYVPPTPGAPAFYPELGDDASWRVGAALTRRVPGMPYGPLEQVEDLVDKLNSGEVML